MFHKLKIFELTWYKFPFKNRVNELKFNLRTRLNINFDGVYEILLKRNIIWIINYAFLNRVLMQPKGIFPKSMISRLNFIKIFYIKRRRKISILV